MAAAGADVEVVYHSFELAPDTPLDFVGTPTDYLVNRMGIPRARAIQMNEHVTALAARVGLEYHMDTARQVNTVRAHELSHFAKAEGQQLPMIERLFRAYFTESRNLGSVDELVALAGDLGLDTVKAEHALRNNTYLPAVKADVKAAARYGINGVPFFVFDDTYGVSGAQPADTFAAVIAEISAGKGAGS